MTLLDRTLAKTFRAARWDDTNGAPVCPDCFEGDALVVDQPDRLAHPGLHSYRCRDCNTRFSDLSGTPLRGSSQTLRSWAIALLTWSGHPHEPVGRGARMKLLPRDLGVPVPQLVRMRERLSGTRTATAWLTRLHAEKITLGKLTGTKRRAA